MSEHPTDEEIKRAVERLKEGHGLCSICASDHREGACLPDNWPEFKRGDA